MYNLAIICDSSAMISPLDNGKSHIYSAPLTLIHNNIEYLDQVTINQETINSILEKNEVISTSQPNLGTIIEILETVKSKQYDHVFVLPISSHLSGTHSAFNQSLAEVSMDNVTIIDSYTVGGPVRAAVSLIENLNQEGKSIQEIIARVENHFNNTESYLLPRTLDQLKAGGRISKTAAAMASLLKIKALLKLENKGVTIEKFDTARTETKIIDIIIEDLIKNNITPKTHTLHLLHSEALDTVENIQAAITTKLGAFEFNIMTLPPALATHAGLGAVTIQTSLKY